MIISGGVNIYPQEIEDMILTHPGVADVAVIGVPNPDFGEEVKAVVQPMRMADAGQKWKKRSWRCAVTYSRRSKFPVPWTSKRAYLGFPQASC